MSGRLSAPGEHAARARIETVFAWVDQLSAIDIYEMSSPSIDLDDRDARLAELERLADGAGRGALLDDACEALTNAVVTRLANIRTYPYGVMTAGTARAEDQFAIVTALRDLVAVAVMQDRLEPEDARALAGPGLMLLRSRLGELDDPALADLVAPVDETATPPSWAPSEEEWAAAEAQAGGAEREDPPDGDDAPPGTRVMRRTFFVVTAVVGVIAAMAWALAEDSILVGLLIAGAVVALCWTFATWSPSRR